MKLRKVLLTCIVLFVTIANSYAQLDCIDPDTGLPPDPDVGCPIDVPLDDWVIAFGFIAVAITAVYMHKKQQKALV